MNDDVVIKVDGVWKRYGLPLVAVARGLVKRLRSRGSMLDDGGPWALRDVSFEVKRGETLGIIGRNGAGKSTLLKILAGVTPPTRGYREVRGRVFPMIELNAGIHPELTGRENVRLLGAIMGLSRQKVERHMPEIEEFTELGEWFDRPVRKYSSGMLARLGFGVAMNIDADILLIDEVLAVGDFPFQKKCINRMSQLIGGGMTMLFVSHNPYMVERMCDRVALLCDGIMEELGDPSEVIHRYFAIGMKESREVASMGNVLPPHLRPGTGDLRFTKVEILNGKGHPTSEVATGEPVTFRLHYKSIERLWEPNLSVRIFDPQNTMVIAFVATQARKNWELYGEGHIDCRVKGLPLMPNTYTIQVKSSANVLLDLVENAAYLVVRSYPKVLVGTGNLGIVFAEADWRHGKS